MNKTKLNKIVKLNQAPLASEVVERVLGKLQRGEITEFIIIARSRVAKEDQEDVGGCFLLDKYWYSEASGIPVIGLLEYMKQEVYEYVAGYRRRREE